MPRHREPSAQLDFFAPSVPPAKAERRGPRPVAAATVDENLKHVADAMPPSIRLGTSSWSFPGWNGIVYGEAASKQRLAGRGLEAYARHPLLRAVGIDRTYYAPLPAAELARYAEVAPADFRFLMKAHEACTITRYPDHPRYGDARGTINNLFLDAAYATNEVVGPFMEGLREKCGPLLFQFSPQDLSVVDGPAGFVERLHRFLEALPRGPLYAVELRDARLLKPAYRRALSASGACHCLNAHATMPDIATQATRAGEFPATIIRWMLRRGFKYDEAKQRYDPFDRIVDADPASLDAIAEQCVAAARHGREAYVIINNKAEGSAPLSAFRLAEAIVRMVNGNR